MDSSEMVSVELDRFRGFLRLLARTQLPRKLRGKLDPSDIVQQTLLEAHKARESFRGQTAREQAGWLRTILAHTLANTIRGFGREKRDVAKELPLDGPLRLTAMRLESWLVAQQSTPSRHVTREEETLSLAEAVASLPEDQQDAILLRHCEGLTLQRIGEELGVSESTATRLIRCGLESLREKLEGLR